MKYLMLLVSSLVLCSTLNAQDFNMGVDGFELLRDSGIRGPSYEQQLLNLTALQKKYPKVAQTFSYGRSMGGRTLAGVILSISKNPTRMILITGATHGNEYLNIVDRLPHALMNKQSSALGRYLRQGGAVVVVPIFNPDGYEERRRRNNNNADLNRDFPNPLIDLKGFKQVESTSLAQFIHKYISVNNKKFDLAMDYHCCVSGMLLIPWGYKNLSLTKAQYATYEPSVNAMLKSFANPGRVGSPPNLLYSAQGTSLDYWFQYYGAVSMTYEGRHGDEAKLLPNHVFWWEQIFDSFTFK